LGFDEIDKVKGKLDEQDNDGSVRRAKTRQERQHVLKSETSTPITTMSCTSAPPF